MFKKQDVADRDLSAPGTISTQIGGADTNIGEHLFFN